ncbi:hypothetical protein HRG_005445 [Hirsutella rhossiliensis]|uniref:Uncharacterized protein n=1 Tax=Hirsutella rhossiliensis TaxID=111463 RepID=A0A9P8MX92_9HYPO|nr:uncharacterized protein HRG_05445 [Hirsutella rhossiliensis]KAH0962935.1 hypothetical protein HRG_05445 [Hirsutella rhossiliensis]
MGTRALKIVRFRRRYYIRHYPYDGYFQGLGAEIVASIPADPDEYRKWLESVRDMYAARERVVEQAYEMCGSSGPGNSQFHKFATLPSELPRLDRIDAEYFYIINLDHEVLTMNFSIHWKLGNIPRQDDLWLRSIEDSIYQDKPTISLDLCPQEHMGSLALELPEKNQEIGYSFHTVTPRMDIKEAPKVFATRLLAGVLIEYKNDMIRFGREWSPDSFPFRELTFALVSIASGQAKFHSFPAQRCHPRHCRYYDCTVKHLPKSGWLDQEWAGDGAPLMEFGSIAHRPGGLPGASPTETIYWHQSVLVSLTLVIDGQAVTKAVSWGIEQGRTDFQIVVLSLFKVAFVEVSSVGATKGPLLKVSHAVRLSPLQAEYCGPHGDYGVNSPDSRHSSTSSTSLRVAVQHPDLVDYDTWKACSVVSYEFRYYSLFKHRVNDCMRIVSGPFVRLQNCGGKMERRLSFNFENMQTGKILPMMEVPSRGWMEECNSMPVIGSDRKALMADMVVQFRPVEDVPVEADSDDER